jgi:hypothetical protein
VTTGVPSETTTVGHEAAREADTGGSGIVRGESAFEELTASLEVTSSRAGELLS